MSSIELFAGAGGLGGVDSDGLHQLDVARDQQHQQNTHQGAREQDALLDAVFERLAEQGPALGELGMDRLETQHNVIF